MSGEMERDDKYDVFLVHSSEDEAKARRIDEVLRENGLKTYAHYRSASGEDPEGFYVGKFVFDNISYAVQNSRTILILVTPNALTSGWVTFEIILSIEKSFKRDAMCVRLLFEGLEQDEIKQFKIDDFEFIPDFILDLDNESWNAELVATLNEPHPKLGDVLPVGNVAHGLVFNYFTGFLTNILPKLTATIIESSMFHQEHKMLQKFVVLIPSSSQVIQIEGAYGDVVIKKEKACLEIMVQYGDKLRPFKLSIFSITKGEQTYYFTGECPFIIETMYKMTRFAKVGPTFLKFQVERFRKTLMALVNHRGNLPCTNTVCFVNFDDSAQDSSSTLGDTLWSAVETSIQEQTGKTETDGPKTVRKVGKMDSQSKSGKKYFATITHQDTDLDKRTAEDVNTFLADKEVNFTNGDGKMTLSILGEAEWNIFVISKSVCQNQELLTQYNSALQESVNNDVIQVIPIIAMGTNIKDIPEDLRFVTMLQEKEDKSHLKQMWKMMQGEHKTMKESLPFVPVHQGLVYAYTVNYLAIALVGQTEQGKGFRERFEDGMVEYEVECRCVPRVFLITAESCEIPTTNFENERHLGALQPVVLGFRKYFLHLYELTMKNGMKVCYAREYTTPSNALHEMAHKYPFAGMNVDQMKVEAFEFVQLCRKVTQDESFTSHIGDIKDKCHFVYFNDAKESMPDAIERELQTYLDTGEFITPTELD